MSAEGGGIERATSVIGSGGFVIDEIGLNYLA
jgi:hypothetical protein